MTILEALRKITEEIKSWAESKFFNKNNIDTALSSSSTNPVQNKVINSALSKKASTSSLTSHTDNTSNPHSVTKEQVGLENVDNTSDADKPVSTAQATAIADAKKAGTDAQDAIDAHAEDTSNPHGVTKSQVGLSNVPNVTTNNQTPTFTAATTLATLTSGEKLSVAFGKISKAITDLISHIGNKSNPHEVTATQIGAVPTTRTINNKDLSANITLSASDVSAVPTTRTINSKALSSNITLSASDVSAVPTTRTVNGKALSSNITLSASDVGALPDTTVIPSKLSEMTADSTHRTVTDTEKATWNAKTSFSGNYNDLTNKPTIPSIAGLATETYVNNKVAGLVDSAPTTLDTLNELAAALGDDPNFATTIATQIGELEDRVGNIDVSDQINNALNAATADDFGIYVQASEPTKAVAGDIWIDTANDPTYTAPVIPTITASDNGKVLMVVNGKLQLADLNLSIDANGVVSM